MTTVTLANSFVLGQPSTDAAGVTWWHRSIDGWRDGVPMRTNFVDRPTGPGSYDGPSFPSKRVVVLNGSARAPNHAARLRAMRMLTGLGADGAMLSLRVADELGETEAMVRRSDKPTITMTSTSWLDYSLQWTAPEPRLLDVATRTASTQMAQSGLGGVAWNGPVGGSGTRWNGPTGDSGLSWGAPVSTGVVELDNTDGTAPADVIVTITGPALNPSISTATHWITYNGALSSTDVLVINTGSGSVQLNGVNRRSYLTRANWFQIPAGGSIDVRFTAEVQNFTAAMTCSWRVSYY
ncbi:phage distal tail protein [Saccharopolyspora sp. NPDC002376]